MLIFHNQIKFFIKLSIRNMTKHLNHITIKKNYQLKHYEDINYIAHSAHNCYSKNVIN